MKPNIAIFLGLALAFASATSFAHDVELAGKPDGPPGGDHFRRPGGCHLELTDEQQAKMKSEKFKFMDSQIDLAAQLKHSKLAFRKVLSDPTSDYGAAKSAAKEVASNLSKLVTAKELLKAEMAFKVLTADQRKEAEKCHRGHGGGHHFGPESGFGKQADMEENTAPQMPQEELAFLDEEEDFI